MMLLKHKKNVVILSFSWEAEMLRALLKIMKRRLEMIKAQKEQMYKKH